MGKKDNWDIILTYIFATIGPLIYFTTDLEQGGGLLLVVIGPFLLVATLLSMGITITRSINNKLGLTRTLWFTPIIILILYYLFLYKYF